MKTPNRSASSKASHPRAIDPKYDKVFKAIMAKKEYLLSFVSAVFHYLGLPRVADVACLVGDREIDGPGVDGKSGSLDILVTLENQLTLVLEMQFRKKENIVNRMLFYLKKHLRTSLRRGTRMQVPQCYQPYCLS
jgi:predicted transposase/invertase (TIGR01784 family)